MKLYMPDGTAVEQGGPEDRATWWTCKVCGFTGPHVGAHADGRKVCRGISCSDGNVTKNPGVPRCTPPESKGGGE